MFDRNTLKDNLSKCVGVVSFNKADGSIREMTCTLMSDYLPEQKPLEDGFRHLPRKDNTEVLSVWDIDNKGWRSFRLDSINNIEYIGVNRV